MRNKIIGVIASAALLTSVFSGPAQASETITAGGASYTNALQQVCTQEYTTNKVTYASVGSGTGKRNYRSGTYDFGGSDSLYGPTEVKPLNFTYVPILGGPVTIAYNLTGVTRLNLTPKIVGDIYLGKITKWNDKAITALNKTAKLPDATITPVYRSDGSGTSFNFTNWLQQKYKAPFRAVDAFQNTAGAGALVKGAVASPQNSGVATTIAATPNSIGYIDIADADKAKLPYAHVQNSSGQMIKPTIANSKLFIEKQLMKSNGQVVFDYNQKIRGAYDLSLVSYGIAPTKLGTPKAAAIADYLKFFVNTCSQQNAAQQGYVALSGTLLRKANELIGRVK